jgi:hypothetical protein
MNGKFFRNLLDAADLVQVRNSFKRCWFVS